MIFPLYSQNKNILTSLKGEVGYFFKVESADLENIKDLEPFYEQIESQLISLEHKDIYRFYYQNGETYLYTNLKNPLLEGMKLTPKEKPLEFFFGGELFSSVDFEKDYFLFQGKYARLFSAKEFSECLQPSELSRFGDFVLSFKKIDSEKAIKKLKFKRRIHFSGLFAGIRNIESEASFKESDELLENLTRFDDALFDVEVFFIVKGDSKKDLNQKSQALLERTKTKGLVLRLESLALTYFFSSLIPGVRPSFKRAHLTPASFLKFCLPFESERLMNEGMSFYSRKGRPLKFTLFNPSSINYNALVTGEAGQGKSMLVNKIVHDEVKNGASAVILDFKGSFGRNVRYLGGKSIEGRFNPLSFPDHFFLKEFITSHIPSGLDVKDQGRLVSLIKEELPHVSSFEKLIARLSKTFPDLPYYFEEVWDYYSDEELKLNYLSYLDFELFPEKLKAPLILFIFEKFKTLKGKKIFAFDECWHLLQKNAGFIAESFRTLRKLEGSAIAIGQNLDDFLSSPLGKVVAQNTFYKFYLRQNLACSEFIDPWMNEKIQTLHSKKGEYSEAFLSFEGMQKIIRYKATPLEYELFTTDGLVDRPMYEKYMREAGQFLPFHLAMENLARIRHGEQL